MSYRERRNRKDSRAKTITELYAWHCGICMIKITHREVRQGLIIARQITEPRTAFGIDQRDFEVFHRACLA